jgi:hypothetical protein
MTAIANTSPKLSPSLDEYGGSFITDENGNVIPVVACLPLSLSGRTGSAGLTITQGPVSQVTGRQSPPQVNTTGKPVPLLVLASVSSAGVLGPLKLPQALPYREVSASTTLVANDGIIGVTSTSAPRVITLPAANSVTPGQPYKVKDESGLAGTNNITITPAGGDTIDGASTLVISANYGRATFYSNGVGQWFTA